MTCVIALKKENKVYMGGDSRRSYINGKFIDYDDEPKILTVDGITFGFSGPAGIQNMFETFCTSLKLSQYKLEVIARKMLNMLTVI